MLKLRKLGPIGACPEKGRPFPCQHNSDKRLIFVNFFRSSKAEKIAGRQDHTTSPYASCAFVFAHSASTASHRTFVTIASRPSIG